MATLLPSRSVPTVVAAVAEELFSIASSFRKKLEAIERTERWRIAQRCAKKSDVPTKEHICSAQAKSKTAPAPRPTAKKSSEPTTSTAPAPRPAAKKSSAPTTSTAAVAPRSVPKKILQRPQQSINSRLAGPPGGLTTPSLREVGFNSSPRDAPAPSNNEDTRASTSLPTAMPQVPQVPAQPPLVAPVTPATFIPQHDDDDEEADLDELVGWWDGTNFDAAVIAAFQRHHGPLPTVVRMIGSDLLQCLRAPKALHIPTLAKLGIVKTTHQEHQRMLTTLLDLPTDLLKAPLTTAIIESLTRMSITRRWRATTLLKYLCTAQGALAMLPMYVRTPAILLNNCPIWRQALRGATHRAKQELPRQPAPATFNDVTTAIRMESSHPVRTALILTWLTCARTGCILQLSRDDVDLRPDGSLSIRFRKGKGARVRGPYTVHTTVIPPQLLAMVRSWLDQRKSKLFNMIKGRDIMLALRRVSPTLEQRSLRRGSLMTLSATPGVTDQLLMEFSGHTQVTTLRRYLSWGTQAVHLRTSMVEVAKTLTAPSIRFHHPSGTSIRRE